MKPRAYSYLRFSTPEQAKGDSTRRQQELANEYALKHGLELDTSLNLNDSGISAFRGRNAAEGALGRFLEAIESGVISHGSFLLVESFDRLSRENILKALPTFLTIINAGVTIVTLTDGVKHSKESIETNQFNLFGSLMVMMRAHEESLRKAERLAAVWKNKRTQAYQGQHKLTSLAPKWLRLSKDRSTFELIPERVDVVKRIFQLTLNGYGRRRIACLLNDEGVPTFGKSNGWQLTYIAKILKNRAVLGEYQPHKYVIDASGTRERVTTGESIVDYFPRIIEHEVFNQVQVNLKNRVTPSGPKVVHENVFRGLMFCECGSILKYENKGKPPRGQRYYVCNNTTRGLCNGKRARVDAVEPLLLLQLLRLDFSALTVSPVAKDEVVILQDKLSETTTALQLLSEQIDNVVDAITSMGGSKVLTDKLGLLEGRKVTLEQTLDNIKSKLSIAVFNQRDDTTAIQEMFNAVMETIQAMRSKDTELAQSTRLKANNHIGKFVYKIVMDTKGENLRIELKSGQVEEVGISNGTKLAVDEILAIVEKNEARISKVLMIPID